MVVPPKAQASVSFAFSVGEEIVFSLTRIDAVFDLHLGRAIGRAGTPGWTIGAILGAVVCDDDRAYVVRFRHASQSFLTIVNECEIEGTA